MSVRTKGARKAAGPVRYLLSADRTLRKLSLKRIPVPGSTTNKPRRAVRTKRTDAANGSALVRIVGSRASAVVLAGLIVGAALIPAHRVAQPADPTIDGQLPAAGHTPAAIPAHTDALTTVEPATVLPAASKPRAVSAPVANPPETQSSRPAPAAAAPKAASEAPAVKTKEAATIAKAPATEFAPQPAAAETTHTADAAETGRVAAVTIVGCLERDDDTFVMRNASGDGIQTGRSWKSGFLKKRRPSIQLVDAGRALNLADHVGQRVSATGTIDDRTMRTHSLQTLATSCR